MYGLLAKAHPRTVIHSYVACWLYSGRRITLSFSYVTERGEGKWKGQGGAGWQRVCLSTYVVTENTKMAVFWVVAPCSLVEVYQRFRGPCCFRHHRPVDGGSKDL
jgi:hypothetical protein